MKTLRKILKLLPPAFAMRIWLEKRYGIKVKPSPWKGFAGIMLAILPYAFTAALSVRTDSDCRLIKYFLPYGKMKKFVALAYGMHVGNDKLDSGATGIFRSFMPYGIVLWWDAENAHLDLAARGKHPAPRSRPNAQIDTQRQMAKSLSREETARLDRIEAITLRLLIVGGGFEPPYSGTSYTKE